MLAALMVIVCVVARLVPHPWNFTPIGGAAVLAGRTLKRTHAVALMIGVMLASDLLLTAVHGTSYLDGATPFVYAGFAAQVLLGAWLRTRRGGAIGAAVLGAIAFFALSNFGVWVSGMYGRGASGLFACYVAAIPFFGATIAGDVLWTVILSAAHRALARKLATRGSTWVPVPLADTSPF